MPIVVIPIADLLLDDIAPGEDLTILPEDVLVKRIRRTFGAISSLAHVRLADGMAFIEFDEETERKGGAARKQIHDASLLASTGKYQPAIRLYEQGLAVLPTHTEGRRGLAMAQMELGLYAVAKKNLIKVLQLDPKDADAYLVLGNLYALAEKDYGSAERYYASAIDVAPDNPYVLTSYAILLAQRNQAATAIAMFERAVTAAPPDYPNPRHGLAVALANQGDLDGALAALGGLFGQKRSADPRNAPIYAAAQRLHGELRRRRAATNAEETMVRLQQAIAAYQAETGIDVRVSEDASLTTNAKVELAWRYDRSYHAIKLKQGQGADASYLLAHEFEHVLLETEARAAGTHRLFAVGPLEKASAERQLEREIRKLSARPPVDPVLKANYMARLMQGLANQIFNLPLDLFINRRVYRRYPWLRDALFVGLEKEQAENVFPLKDVALQANVPPTIYRHNITMSAAYALFVDELFEQATAYAAHFEPAGVLPVARRLYKLFLETDEMPGAEFGLVDVWARELGLDEWYVWRREPSAGMSQAG